jgi:prepilin-type N-terminal cleavage/methylation domain-containing protein/prepilin-type processing-associated H-X9-DG protein
MHMKNRKTAFTLVELLVVIGIIAVLIGILLPALNQARASARTIKCAANLRSIGQGLAIYAAENKQLFPAAYMYVGAGQTSGTPSEGYQHWSSYLYGDRTKSGSDAIFQSTVGWDSFVCPAMNDGGLPPTNTYADNVGSGLVVDAAGVLDKQAPRLSYTVNEAVMGRNKFKVGFDGNPRTYRLVNAGKVRDSANVVLATEFNPNPTMASGSGRVNGGALVSKSHRPVHAFEAGGDGYELDKQPPVIPGGVPGYRRNYTLDSGYCEKFAVTPNRLSWIGRVHGRRTIGKADQDTRKTNFLYVDGHVESKRLGETLYPQFQWGDKFYSISQNADGLQNQPTAGQLSSF